jgi:hypothetical protein
VYLEVFDELRDSLLILEKPDESRKRRRFKGDGAEASGAMEREKSSIQSRGDVSRRRRIIEPPAGDH